MIRRYGTSAFVLSAAIAAFALTGCSDAADSQTAIAVDGAKGSAAASNIATDVAAAGSSAAVPVSEQSYSDAWGPQAGSQIPLLAATDHTGEPQTLESLSGSKGLLLVFSRSADW